MADLIQRSLDGYEPTGEFRLPEKGDVWNNGENEVWGGSPAGIFESRSILRKIGESSQVMTDEFIYEYDT